MEINEEQRKINQTMRRIKMANCFRLFFLFIALFVVLLLFYGNKFLYGVKWYIDCKLAVYDFLFLDVIFMFISIIVKMILAGSYNRMIKRMNR